jgi:hypothetical protein
MSIPSHHMTSRYEQLCHPMASSAYYRPPFTDLHSLRKDTRPLEVVGCLRGLVPFVTFIMYLGVDRDIYAEYGKFIHTSPYPRREAHRTHRTFRVSSSPSILAVMYWFKCTYTAHSLDIFIYCCEGVIDSVVGCFLRFWCQCEK